MDDGSPTLEVGFAIDTGGSFEALMQLGAVMGSTEAKILRDAKSIEASTRGMVNVGGSATAITSFASTTSKAFNEAERAAERMTKRVQEQTATIGMTRPALLAWRADLVGAKDAANDLRQAEAGLEAARSTAAASDRAEANAVKQVADEHARLVTAVRGSQAAQEADAAAAERLRTSTDPLYAATKRLNAEIAESTRLYRAGATAPAEYARQQQVLTDRLGAAATQHNTLAGSARRSGFALQQFAIQTPDIAQGLLTGQKPMTVFIQQGGQLVQIAMMAEGGIKGFAAELGGFALAAAPFLIALAAVGGGFALFARSVESGIDTKKMVADLGLTRDEIKKLKDVSIDAGDVISATFQVLSERVGFHAGNMAKGWSSSLDWMTETGRKTLAMLYAMFNSVMPAIGTIVREGLRGASATDILTTVGKDVAGRYQKADAYLKRFAADVTAKAGQNKLKELQAQAAALKADRTAKTDGHAAQLARENEAIEAQIRNLYKLADAYGISGAAALIAEARVKAETAAIKKRGDIEVFVNRQVRLAIAERVVDSAKAAATMRDQARIQTEVNGMVAAGTVPAQRANQIMQERIAELPLLAAIEAAQQRGLKVEADRATNALEDQRSAQADARAAAVGAVVVSDHEAAERRLGDLREEIRLIGATDAARVHAMTTIQATNAAIVSGRKGQQITDYVADQVQIADLEVQRQLRADAFNASLHQQADLLSILADNVARAGQGMAEAFGSAGQALGDLTSRFASYLADQKRLADAKRDQLAVAESIVKADAREREVQRINGQFAARNLTAQVGLYGDLASSAKGFFKEGTDGYKAMQKAEQVFRAVEFALSVRAIAQDAIETGASLAKSAARTAAHAVEAVTKAISSLPFPLNIAAGAATIAALAAIGVSVAGSFGGGGGKAAPTNTGTGTVLGDPAAKSESIKNAIDALKEVDTLMLSASREMAASLRSIDQQIGGFAAQILKAGDINANAGVTQGFKPNVVGSVLGSIPLIGGILKGLFGSTTTVTGSGLYGGAQSLGSVLGGGFDASYYSDVQKKSKLFGITTSTKNSTQYTGADGALENQFTLILREFNNAIVAAAGPLGASTDAIQQRLNGFIVNIGKIDLTGLTGDQVTEKLSAVFGAAADQMATGAFPEIARFQKAGEGAFETLVRVASTVEQVSASLNQLGASAKGMGIDAKLGIASQFDSVSDFRSAADGYFQAFYTKEEQAAAKAAQFAKVFDSMGLAVPSTLAAFRELVEAQNLTTAAGQSTYATLLQLAPAFADLQSSMAGAKSAADIASERQDLQRQLLELQGDTAAIRALDLAKTDASNRGLQEQVYAMQDAQKAADAAKQLRDAWTSVGETIETEIKRIRGLNGTTGGSFASLQGQFNAATAAARGGDQDAAKSLPGLSQAMLTAAALVATSRQELDRVQAATAASLEATKAQIDTMAMNAPSAMSGLALLEAASAAQAASSAGTANVTMADDVRTLREELRALREEVAAMRTENNSANAAIAGNTGSIKRKLDDVTGSGGDAIDVRQAA